MRNTMKKILAIIFAALMIASTLPLAFAEDSEESDSTITSGNFTYELDENGEVSIVSVNNEVTGNIVIPSVLDGLVVATIEEAAFEGCTRLSGIEFEEGIKTIKSEMRKLRNLESVTIPKSIDCEDMLLPLYPVKVTADDNITVYYSDTNENATLYIDDSFSEAEVLLDIDCYKWSLETIVLDENNISFKLVDGVLYNSDITTIYLYPIASDATSYVMPDTVLYRHSTISYFDCFMYYAENLKEITIGKNFNYAFETAEAYYEYWDVLLAEGGLEYALNTLTNSLFIFDGVSPGIFLYNKNLEAIYVSPEHEFFTSKNGVLCLKNDEYDAVLVYPGSKTGDIILDENDFINDSAFLSLQEGHNFIIKDGFGDIPAMYNDPESIVRLFIYLYASKFTVSQSNEYFSSDEYGALYNKDKTELIKFPIASDAVFYRIPESVTSLNVYAFSSYRFLNVSSTKNVTVHIHDELSNIPLLNGTICTDLLEANTVYTYIDSETGDEVSMTGQEIIDSYNDAINGYNDRFEEYEERLAEVEEMFLNSEITRLVYDILLYEIEASFLALPRMTMTICQGHKETEPDYPEPPKEPDDPEEDDNDEFYHPEVLEPRIDCDNTSVEFYQNAFLGGNWKNFKITGTITNFSNYYELEDIWVTIKSPDKNIIKFNSDKEDEVTFSLGRNVAIDDSDDFKCKALVNRDYMPEGGTDTITLTCILNGKMDGEPIEGVYSTFDVKVTNLSCKEKKPKKNKTLRELLEEMRDLVDDFERDKGYYIPTGLDYSILAVESAIGFGNVDAGLDLANMAYDLSFYLAGITNPAPEEFGKLFLEQLSANSESEVDKIIDYTVQSLKKHPRFNEFINWCCDEYGVDYGEYTKHSNHCPTDIVVIDEFGDTVLEIINNEILTCNEGVIAYVFEGNKTFYLPVGIEHEIKIMATDNGTMDYFVESMTEYGERRTFEYNDIVISKGQIYKAIAPENAVNEADVYNLVDENGKIIKAGNEIVKHDLVYVGIASRPATCVLPGMGMYDCSKCKYYETQKLPATGHTFDGSECINCDYDKADECDCKCHTDRPFAKFFFKIKLFFWKLFKKNAVCDCGAAHY